MEVTRWVQSLQRTIAALHPEDESGGAIAGVVWAIEDHPALWRGSVDAVVNAVRAAPANVVTPWLVLDAVMKSTVLPEAAAAAREQLPLLVGTSFARALKQAAPHHSLLAAARSWAALGLLDGGAAGGVPERLQFELARTEADTKRGAQVDVVVKPDAAIDAAKRETIAKVLRCIAEQQQQQPGGSDAAQTKGAGSSKLTGARAVAHVQEQLHWRQAPLSCSTCGAYFDSEEARSAHSRMHYYWKLENTPLARLPDPTLAEFVGYDSNHADGRYVANFAKATAAGTRTAARFK